MFNIFEMGKSDPCGDLVCCEEIGDGVPISDILLFDGGHMAFILPFDALGVSFADFAGLKWKEMPALSQAKVFPSKMWVCVGVIHVLANSSV